MKRLRRVANASLSALTADRDLLLGKDQDAGNPLTRDCTRCSRDFNVARIVKIGVLHYRSATCEA
jgi:hypothetical protein